MKDTVVAVAFVVVAEVVAAVRTDNCIRQDSAIVDLGASLAEE